MKIKLSVLALFISMLLTGQVLAFDLDGLSYSVLNPNDVQVTGRESGNSATDIVIPDTVVDSGTTYDVTAIGENAFNTNALTSVIIPDSVTDIGDGAFADNALFSVIIPDSVTTVGAGAFAYNALTSVIIPDSVTTIGAGAFAYNALASVIIPDSVTTTGAGAFAYNALTNVIIPDSVTTIGAGAFAYNALTSVIIPDSVTTIGEGAFADNALTSVIIPDSVTTIGAGAFAYNALASVIIPDSVTTIGEGAFADNALVSVIIPNSVTTIGDDAFYNNAFTSAAFRGDFGNFNLNMFNSNPTLATITYCDVKAGWPQGFNNSSTIVVTTPISCSPPDAPTIDSVVPGNAQVIIATTPGADNGSPITSYTAFCFGDTLIFGASPTSPITVSGLTNDVSYACAVTAANDVGTSPSSAVSAPFTPVGPPPGC
ncbi:MAG: leucine-rich repeat domain-containing protein [Halioglobus sp.]|nr:leucine-rich repeat domain-containing protein [Halioglobus sp.]